MKQLTATAIPSLLCDFYKTAHRNMYPQGIEYLYSTLTPRSNKHASYVDRVVVFGIQGFIQKYLINYFNDNFFHRPEDEVVNEHREFIRQTLGFDEEPTHIRELHRLQKLPLKIKAIPEGLSVAIKVPVLTIENTDPRFAWLTNYMETLFNCSLWQPMVSASIAKQFHKQLNVFADETCDNAEHIAFQAHDFSMRGMSSLESAETSGAAHLVYFKGTDTIPAISYVQHYYGSDDLIGTSIAATEHSIMSSHGVDEVPTFRFLMKQYPNSMLSVVSDTTDFWHNIEHTLVVLKDEIMQRPPHAKLVIRPDSGDPIKIVNGTLPVFEHMEDAEDYHRTVRFKVMEQIKTISPVWKEKSELFKFGIKDGSKIHYFAQTYENNRFDRQPYAPTVEEKGLAESLWDIFGGTVNSKGYKVLDPHIGMVYGDGITFQRMHDILVGLKEKGFASSNIVFGVGSFTYQLVSRDSLGFATKATSVIINGVEKPIFKDPKTDDGTKKSQRGRVIVPDLDTVIDGLNKEEADKDNLLQTIFEDGELLKHFSFDEVRENALR